MTRCRSDSTGDYVGYDRRHALERQRWSGGARAVYEWDRVAADVVSLETMRSAMVNNFEQITTMFRRFCASETT